MRCFAHTLQLAIGASLKLPAIVEKTLEVIQTLTALLNGTPRWAC